VRGNIAIKKKKKKGKKKDINTQKASTLCKYNRFLSAPAVITSQKLSSFFATEKCKRKRDVIVNFLKGQFTM